MQFRRQSVAWSALWAAAAVPFLCAVVFHAIGSHAQKPAKGQERPSLVFDQYLVNVGKVDSIPQVHAWFQFYNRSNRPLIVESIKPSCGCLQPLLEKIGADKVSGGLSPVLENIEFGPKEAGRILLRVTTAGQKPGHNEYTVNVNYTDSIPRETTLTFKVELPEQTILIQPRALRIHQLGSEPTVQQVVISDLRAKPCTVLSVESSSGIVSVTLHPPATAADPSLRATLEVTIRGDITPGPHEVLISARTDDPQFPKLTIPVLVFGPGGNAEHSNVRQASHVHSTAYPDHADTRGVIPPERESAAH